MKEKMLKDNTQKEVGIVAYLQAHPSKAMVLVEKAQEESIAEIKGKYSDAIKASDEASAALKYLVDQRSTLVKIRKKGDRSGNWRKELQRACKMCDKEIERIKYEYQSGYMRHHDAYKQEAADCEAAYGELRFLLLKQ